MTNLVDALRTKDKVTENGMLTSSSTLNATLDLFFMIGAIRKDAKSTDGKFRLISKFEAARNEDSHLTRKLIFWARDVRGGAGEREAFRVLIRYIAKTYPSELIPNLHLIAEYGRWDDIFSVFGTEVESEAITLIVSKLKEGDQLLAKWLPRTGGKVSSSKKLIANRIRSHMGLKPAEFRKMIVGLTNVVETPMCERKFNLIEYSHVPSVAMARYTNAFNKNDASRFDEYKQKLVLGETKVNAGAVYPYDVIKTLKRGDKTVSVEQWKALPNFMEGSNERVLPLCDTSGSMETAISGETTALDVCISLGLYISERNEGPFKNAFITFSSAPKLQYLTGNLASRYEQMSSADWGMSTNLESAFKLILNQAKKHSIAETEMPTAILIMSDMEFNQATYVNDSAIDMIRRKYEESGYTMPKIIFWNLCSRHDNFPVKLDEKGTALISGFSPSILKTILTGKSINPVDMMLETLNAERYSPIK